MKGLGHFLGPEKSNLTNLEKQSSLVIHVKAFFISKALYGRSESTLKLESTHVLSKTLIFTDFSNRILKKSLRRNAKAGLGSSNEACSKIGFFQG